DRVARLRDRARDAVADREPDLGVVWQVLRNAHHELARVAVDEEQRCALRPQQLARLLREALEALAQHAPEREVARERRRLEEALRLGRDLVERLAEPRL